MTKTSMQTRENLLKRGLTSEQLTTILGDLLLAPITAELSVRDINTDTRTLSAGQTFVALSGEQFDGHRFIEQAIAQGANAIMLERPCDSAVPQIVVRNTRLALGRIASAIRDDFVVRGGKIVGLTGSVGKTTNKQMLASMLSQAKPTHATKGNLNNDLGVPFTWFDLSDDAHFAVIEMGANHQGEIDYLAGITRPHVAMITNAGEAHLEGFGGLDGVAKGKGELFARLNAGDTAVINADDRYADYWRGLLAEGVTVKTFSLHDTNADVCASDISDNGAHFTLHDGDTHTAIELPTVGLHNVGNALGCAACALALGVDMKHIAAGLSQFSNAKGRLQKHVLGGLTVIDDTYNANPMSMRASATILSTSNNYRIMVVGDMGELGDNARELHAQLGADLVDKADAFLCLGDNMQAFAERNPKASHYENIGALNNALLTLVKERKSATVLVKGSRSMQMERVVAFLQARFDYTNWRDSLFNEETNETLSKKAQAYCNKNLLR